MMKLALVKHPQERSFRTTSAAEDKIICGPESRASSDYFLKLGAAGSVTWPTSQIQTAAAAERVYQLDLICHKEKEKE